MTRGESIFPIAYGNEEELSLMMRVQKNAERLPVPKNKLELLLPQGLKNGNSYLSNGGRLYWDSDHLEITTAECGTLNDVTTRIHASEMIVTHILKENAAHHPGTQYEYNRRVIDAAGNSWGMHDNFGFREGARLLEKNYRPQVLLGHLAARSFIVGAGLIAPDGYYYAQKASKPHEKEEDYGYSPYMIRRVDDRVEVRCGDVNLSGWATRMRLGTTALALAIQQTEYAAEFDSRVPYSTVDSLFHNNHLNLKDDGTIQGSEAIADALQYERLLGVTSLQLAKEYSMPAAFANIAHELLIYCDDFEKVLKGDATIKLLRDRVDWAAKFSHILAQRKRDLEKHEDRQPGDTIEQAWDILYANTTVRLGGSKSDKKQPVPTRGWGYGLKWKVPHPGEDSIKKAITTPPDTRARRRAELIHAGYEITDWDSANKKGRHYLLPEPHKPTIIKRDPTAA